MTSIEFYDTDFLEYFDDLLLDSINTNNDEEIDIIYNNITKEIRKFIQELKKNSVDYFIEVNEIDFMLRIFNIIEEKDVNNLLDIKNFTKIQDFTKRHRNITKTLDNLNTNLMKEKMRIDRLVCIENRSFSILDTIVDFGIFFSLLGGIFYFIENFPIYDEMEFQHFNCS